MIFQSGHTSTWVHCERSMRSPAIDVFWESWVQQQHTMIWGTDKHPPRGSGWVWDWDVLRKNFSAGPASCCKCICSTPSSAIPWMSQCMCMPRESPTAQPGMLFIVLSVQQNRGCHNLTHNAYRVKKSIVQAGIVKCLKCLGFFY